MVSYLGQTASLQSVTDITVCPNSHKGDNMFSTQQKREIADKIQVILRETNHPELPEDEINFLLHVNGKEPWSFAEIHNNGAVPNPVSSDWNESQDK